MPAIKLGTVRITVAEARVMRAFLEDHGRVGTWSSESLDLGRRECAVLRRAIRKLVAILPVIPPPKGRRR